MSTVTASQDAIDLEAMLTAPARKPLGDLEVLRAPRTKPDGRAARRLLDRLLEQTIPAVEAQSEVLPRILEQLGAPAEIGIGLAVGRRQLGLVAEQLSRIVDSRLSTGERTLAPILTALAQSLGELIAVQQRAAVAFAQSPERCEVVDVLADSEARARDRLLFVSPPAYHPTEAHALRHNPRPPRVLRLDEVRDRSGTD